jgi:hypothetical protein
MEYATYLSQLWTGMTTLIFGSMVDLTSCGIAEDPSGSM